MDYNQPKLKKVYLLIHILMVHRGVPRTELYGTQRVPLCFFNLLINSKLINWFWYRWDHQENP